MDVKAPTTTAERCAIARRFKTDYKVTLPILVDGIDNDFEQAMSPWPVQTSASSSSMYKCLLYHSLTGLSSPRVCVCVCDLVRSFGSTR